MSWIYYMSWNYSRLTDELTIGV